MIGKLQGHNVGTATFTAQNGTVIEFVRILAATDGDAGEYYAWDDAGKAYLVLDGEDEAVVEEVDALIASANSN